MAAYMLLALATLLLLLAVPGPVRKPLCLARSVTGPAAATALLGVSTQAPTQQQLLLLLLLLLLPMTAGVV
jgi:hypothetical protein